MTNTMLYRFALVASVFIAGCAATPTNLGTKASQLVPGTSTIDEAVSLLGQPFSRSAMANGAVLLQWMQMNRGYMEAKAAHLAILFDANQRMIRITHEYRSDPK